MKRNDWKRIVLRDRDIFFLKETHFFSLSGVPFVMSVTYSPIFSQLEEPSDYNLACGKTSEDMLSYCKGAAHSPSVPEIPCFEKISIFFSQRRICLCDGLWFGSVSSRTRAEKNRACHGINRAYLVFLYQPHKQICFHRRSKYIMKSKKSEKMHFQ